MELAFDIYGTLIDPYGMEAHLGGIFGSQATQATELWREKQLEYSFRRALMQRYVDFSVCTEQALGYVGRRLRVAISDDTKRDLLEHYRHLPPFPDVVSALRTLAESGHTLTAFSNGTAGAIRLLLENARIAELFSAIVSVDEVKSFKPSPTVYEHLVSRLNVPKERIWLISSNPFDVIGAKACGLRALWVRRDPRRVFDPWEFTPDAEVHSLNELAAVLPGDD